MSLVYEALQRARKEQAIRPDSREAVPAYKKGNVLGHGHVGHLGSSLTGLYGMVQAMIDKKKTGVVVLFTSANPGEGVSTIAQEFAYLAANAKQRKTLLIDGNSHKHTNIRLFNLPVERSIIESIRASEQPADAIQAVSGLSLSVGSLLGNMPAHSIDSRQVRDAFTFFRQSYELTIIDCSPVTEGKISEVAPESADGVVMVIQAEKTRPAVIAYAKGMIQQAGGEVIGAVLNKRNSYIPDFIYRLL